MRFSRLTLTSSYPVSLLILLPGLLFAQESGRTHYEMQELHQNSKAYISMLDNPERAAYQKPDEVVATLDLQKGEVVADIGSGSGYFTLRSRCVSYIAQRI